MLRSCMLAAGWLALAAAAGPSQEKPAPLTQQESMEGWLSLFDGESSFGWKIEGPVKVEDGQLVLGGDKPAKAQLAVVLRDFHVDVVAKGSGRLIVEESTPRTIKFGDEFSRVEIFAQASATAQSAMLERAGESREGVTSRFINLHHASKGVVPLRLETSAGESLVVKSLKFKPLNLTSIFNGKDLTGWKIFPDRKTEFSVSTEGWLRARNGPGDLQTEGEWANFVLQLECKTNGDRLNSGVFFRCKPNEYQQGYEAQIHNAFTDKPEKEYTIDEYDPMTQKLTNKRKEKYTAIDYGSGAIYRRQPARRSVARDREWFTMTVLAQGRQLAVWVDGVLVTSWTDNRPDHENARNGYRQAKGPISLQGHDPTTDLYFRNFRIAELP